MQTFLWLVYLSSQSIRFVLDDLCGKRAAKLEENSRRYATVYINYTATHSWILFFAIALAQLIGFEDLYNGYK